MAFSAFLPSPYVEGFNFIPMFFDEMGKVKFTALNPQNVVSYEWNFGDGSPVSTQVNPTHVYAASGDYTVTVKVVNGCSQYTTSQVINVGLTTGMVTLSKDDADIMIYPNPATDRIAIDSRNSNVAMKDIMVFNALGSLVYQHKAESAQHHQLSVSGFASGIYSVRIVTERGYVNRKIVVRR
ncbi:MAG: PKD domain-containing protein [Sphingobacteriales bacterium]|nr:MAG: PKD domain-containing protein [Sphingobacteriales bacterium]